MTDTTPDSQWFVSPIRERVHRRLLQLVGVGPAAFFRDACRLTTEPSGLTTATHLIGHSLREVEGNLLDVLYEQVVSPLPTISSAPSPNLVQPKASLPFAGPDGMGGTSERVAADGDSQIEAKEGHRRKVRAILAALGIPADAKVAQQWMNMAGSRAEKRLHRLAHRNKLNEPRPITSGFLADFDAIVELFDTVLERFETRYGNVYDRLDALLVRAEPGGDGIRLLGETIPNTLQTRSYFFKRLTQPGWLEPLHAAGFFSPPSPELDPSGRTIGFPYWAAAEYLARMAPIRPAIVTRILEDAARTENLRAQTQMIAVMLELRPEDRLRLAGIVKEWSPALRRLIIGDQVPAFATALAHDGALDLAFDLTASVLDLPDPDPATGRRPVQEARYGRDREERAWDLRDATTTLIPALLQADGLRALALFADALDYHIGRRPDETEADPTTPAGLEDFSRHWAADLGRQERHSTGDLRLFLAHVTLEAAKEIGARNPDRVSDIGQVLRQRGGRVIRRIELAALTALLQSETALPETVLPLVVDRLTDRDLLHEADVAPEWGALLAEAFPRVDLDTRRRVVSALVPPDFDWLDPQYAQSRVAAWRRDRLAIIADHLEPDEKKELASLIEAEGEAESLRHNEPRVASWVGPTSPVDADALRGMDVDTFVAFLQQWQQRPGFAEATPEGLGRQMASLVEENPGHYTAWAPRFVGLAPTYVRSLLDGFAAAVRADRVFPWEDVLTLATWVVDQAIPESDMSESGLDADSDWRGARRTVADLLGLGLAAGWDEQGMIPAVERDRLWRMIERLTEDPNPSPAYEARYGGTNMDPHTMAINTTRPEAIDAAIRFAIWVAAQTAQSNLGLHDIFLTAPEVGKLLDRHLDGAIDPSLAVRAAIGTWLGTLARTDPDWVRERLGNLLPTDAEARERRDALWDAYARWSQPHPEAMAVLDSSYRAAIERIGTARGTRHIGEGPDERLAEHIMQLYWWGAVTLEQPSSLLVHFFERADAARRKYAIHFVGFSLFHTDKPAATEPVQRLRGLWEWRIPQLATAAGTDGQLDTDNTRAARAELEEFGWWFASGSFEPEWALAHLERVLALAGEVEIDHAVAEHLEKLSVNYPAAVLRCLSVVDFTGGDKPWSAHSWIDPSRAILRRIVAQEADPVRSRAIELVNRIVAAGHLDFRELLSP